MDIGKYAVENKMKTNYFLVSRHDKDTNYAALCDEMEKGMREDTLYFFSAEDTENRFMKDLQCYSIGDKYIIGVCPRE